MTEPKYIELKNFLKSKIQKGNFQVGDYLPSENDLCKQFSITRTTARKALEELVKENFIERQQGKGSCVCERRKSLGLLNVKGFSEAVGENVKTLFLQNPVTGKWDSEIMSAINENDFESVCIFFERLRFVGQEPVMLEKNWFSGQALPGFLDSGFVDGSFFKTLSKKYFIEITGSSQELRAEFASEKNAALLKVEPGTPLLHISVKFLTSNPNLNIYSELYCVTSTYPIGNSYYI
jgi:GntR family transcriptional regulator/GntR family frlABCD operon transcriptional regulator